MYNICTAEYNIRNSTSRYYIITRFILLIIFTALLITFALKKTFSISSGTEFSFIDTECLNLSDDELLINLCGAVSNFTQGCSENAVIQDGSQVIVAGVMFFGIAFIPHTLPLSLALSITTLVLYLSPYTSTMNSNILELCTPLVENNIGLLIPPSDLNSEWAELWKGCPIELNSQAKVQWANRITKECSRTYIENGYDYRNLRLEYSYTFEIDESYKIFINQVKDLMKSMISLSILSWFVFPLNLYKRAFTHTKQTILGCIRQCRQCRRVSNSSSFQSCDSNNLEEDYFLVNVNEIRTSIPCECCIINQLDHDHFSILGIRQIIPSYLSTSKCNHSFIY